MLVVLTETYCNKVNIHITQRDDFFKITHKLKKTGVKKSVIHRHFDKIILQ